MTETRDPARLLQSRAGQLDEYVRLMPGWCLELEKLGKQIEELLREERLPDLECQDMAKGLGELMDHLDEVEDILTATAVQIDDFYGGM